eukprot:3844867-Amphidinium_carterae.1
MATGNVRDVSNFERKAPFIPTIILEAMKASEDHRWKGVMMSVFFPGRSNCLDITDEIDSRHNRQVVSYQAKRHVKGRLFKRRKT